MRGASGTAGCGAPRGRLDCDVPTDRRGSVGIGATRRGVRLRRQKSIRVRLSRDAHRGADREAPMRSVGERGDSERKRLRTMSRQEVLVAMKVLIVGATGTIGKETVQGSGKRSSVHPADEILKPRIGPQPLQLRFDCDPPHPGRLFPVTTL